MTNFKGRVQRFEHGEYRVSIELPPDSKRDKDEKTDNQKPGYQIDRFPDGTNICEIDSIQSQANRIEPQFKTIKDGKLVPQITIEVGTQTVNLLDAGHRAADAVVRMSSLAKEFHDAWLAAKAGDLFALATLAPTAIVFGAWDSRSSQAKLQRLIKAHIRATNVLERTRSAQYTPAADYVGLGAIDESVNVGEDDKNNPSQEVFCADPATCFDGDHYPTLDPAKLAKGKVKPAEYLFDCPPWHLCLDTETIHAQRWPTVPGSRWVNYTRPEEKRTFSFARRRQQEGSPYAPREESGTGTMAESRVDVSCANDAVRGAADFTRATRTISAWVYSRRSARRWSDDDSPGCRRGSGAFPRRRH